MIDPERITAARTKARTRLYDSDHICDSETVFCAHWFDDLDRLIALERVTAMWVQEHGDTECDDCPLLPPLLTALSAIEGEG